MSLETWVSIGALLVVGLTLFATIRKTGRDLRSELKEDITTVRTELSATRVELKADIAAVRTELSATRTELKADIGRLDDRVYALAAGLRPALEEHPSAPAATREPGRN